MGRDVYETSAAARAIFDEADRVLGYKLSELCFAGPAERLNDTTVAQPAILATSVALFEAMVESGDAEDRTPRDGRQRAAWRDGAAGAHAARLRGGPFTR
jgi:malonyl CoA-acyl carrier protein transacylase